MINDLDTNAQQWKYEDDTTESEVEAKGGVKSCASHSYRVLEWSGEKRGLTKRR